MRKEVEMLSEKYRSELKNLEKIKEKLSELLESNESDKKTLTYDEYTFKQSKIEIIERSISMQKNYCSGIFDAREMIMDISID